MSWKYLNKPTIDRARMYEIIRSPVITEKSTLGSENNQVTFKVPLSSTKPEIRAAIEELFEVKVKSVNTLRQKGKNKVFRAGADVVVTLRRPSFALRTVTRLT